MGLPPLPFSPYPDAPIYALGDNQFLVDVSAIDAGNGQGMHNMAQPADDFPPLPPGAGSGDGGDGTNGIPFIYSFPTNGLWLEITGVTNGLADVNLHNATNSVYAILSKTDLSATNWAIEQEVWPTNSAIMPFEVQENDRTNLFLWAMDWTGVTENGNTTPDWWFFEYFGAVAFPNGVGSLALADTNLDSVGNTLLSDYQNNQDPNVITFSVSFTNNHVRTSSAGLQLGVSAGLPYNYAVLLDSTNFAGANWTPYASSNVTASLGGVDGWHQVWIGLKGFPTNATQAWQTMRLKLDLTPPTLILTNPVSNTVSLPLLEIGGYCPEALASISCDLSNAAGTWVSLNNVGVSKQLYTTNTAEFTTNYFDALDLLLTNGLNTVTFHATDLAGNVTTTNFNFTLDTSSRTNPPVVNLYWPQNGALISGGSFTWRGWVDDPSASVAAEFVDTNGCTNIFNGIVERDGKFWVEDLPLNNGTNFLSLTVIDSASNVAMTNISVNPSPVSLTIYPPGADLWNKFINVYGAISNGNDYTLWVNGVKATLNDDGTWAATNVYLPDGGTALIQARAIPNSDNGGNGTGGSGGGPSAYDNPGNPASPDQADAEMQTNKPAEVIEIADNYDAIFIETGTARRTSIKTRRQRRGRSIRLTTYITPFCLVRLQRITTISRINRARPGPNACMTAKQMWGPSPIQTP